MPSFRPYTDEELRTAAQEYGIDPAFVEAVYAVESSRGTNPNAMRARSVKRKRDSTIVRGPFQLEDDTTSDLIKRQKLGRVDVDDPGTHLDLAMRLMRELVDKHAGDYRKVAQEYLGGPGGVTNPKAADELGTTTGAYGNKILAEMNNIKQRGDEPIRESIDVTGTRMPPVQGLDFDRDMESDAFGMPREFMLSAEVKDPDRVSWHDLVAANRSEGLGIPSSMGGDLPNEEEPPELNLQAYLSRLLDEELQGKDFAHAA